MQIQTKRIDKMLSDGGIVFVILSVELPELLTEGKMAKRLSAYYAALSALYHAAAEKYLASERSAYAVDPDPKKRFTHRPLRLCCRTEISGEGPYRILRRLSLSRGGAVLWERETLERVDTQRGLLPEPKARKLPRKKKEGKRETAELPLVSPKAIKKHTKPLGIADKF